MRRTSSGSDLTPHGLLVGYDAELNIVLPTRHEPKQYDDSLICSIVDANEYTLPWNAIDLY